VPAGESVNGVRCENLEKLSFDDKSIDLHVTQDVFEHLFDPAAAFREIARTLRPGGAHVFTTPLENKGAATEFCARRTPDGTIVQLIEPAEYHGNPVSSAGSLLTVRWGYDITQYIFDATGLTTEFLVLDNLELGIRAELIEVLITRASGG
jgi:SAM-dependent methyltransferase